MVTELHNRPKRMADVEIIFGEPESNLRHAIRAALNRAGYENVQDFDRMEPLREAIARGNPDLVLIDTEMDKGEADALISDMRYNRLGKNPFVPVILTIWEPTRELVTRIASSGTDDLLVKPVSPNQVFERIKALVNNRKPFVVTSDYIGPDRRKDASRGSDIPTIDVPNTLEAKVKGTPIKPSEVAKIIAETQKEINEERLKRNAFQTCFLVNLLLPEFDNFMVTDERIDLVDRLIVVARDTGQRMKGTPYEHVSNLCSSLINVVSSIRDSITAPEKKDIDLLKPLSDAIMKAFDPSAGTEDFASQISSAITKYKTHKEREEQG